MKIIDEDNSVFGSAAESHTDSVYEDCEEESACTSECKIMILVIQMMF